MCHEKIAWISKMSWSYKSCISTFRILFQVTLYISSVIPDKFKFTSSFVPFKDIGLKIDDEGAVSYCREYNFALQFSLRWTDNCPSRVSWILHFRSVATKQQKKKSVNSLGLHGEVIYTASVLQLYFFFCSVLLVDNSISTSADGNSHQWRPLLFPSSFAFLIQSKG